MSEGWQSAPAIAECPTLPPAACPAPPAQLAGWRVKALPPALRCSLDGDTALLLVSAGVGQALVTRLLHGNDTGGSHQRVGQGGLACRGGVCGVRKEWSEAWRAQRWMACMTQQHNPCPSLPCCMPASAAPLSPGWQPSRTVVHVGNHGHVTDVVLVLHESTDLLCRRGRQRQNAG